jgi:hypothetical protein
MIRQKSCELSIFSWILITLKNKYPINPIEANEIAGMIRVLTRNWASLLILYVLIMEIFYIYLCGGLYVDKQLHYLSYQL